MLRLSAMVALICTLAAFLGGCSSTPSARASELPDDFSLSVTVLPGQPMQPAWYIVEPDGTLRAAVGERLPQSTRPPAVRTLSRSQVRQVWETATDAGLTDHARLTDRVSPAAASAPGAVAIIDLSALGRRTTAAVGAGDGAPNVAPVVTRLRELAWADQ